MSAIPAIIPCVMIGNIILVVAVSLIAKKIKGNAGLIAGMAAGSIVKALFMGVVIALVLIPSLLPEAMVPKMAVFQTTFSVTAYHSSNRKRACICYLDSFKKGNCRAELKNFQGKNSKTF